MLILCPHLRGVAIYMNIFLDHYSVSMFIPGINHDVVHRPTSELEVNFSRLRVLTVYLAHSGIS